MSCARTRPSRWVESLGRDRTHPSCALNVEQTGIGDTTYYHYDHCGNTVAKQEAAGNTYYQWDFENLMTRVDFPDASHNYFAYDADSKRVEKWDGDGYTEFIYQGRPDRSDSTQRTREESSRCAQIGDWPGSSGQWSAWPR